MSKWAPWSLERDNTQNGHLLEWQIWDSSCFLLDDWFDKSLQFEVNTMIIRHSAETTILSWLLPFLLLHQVWVWGNCSSITYLSIHPSFFHPSIIPASQPASHPPVYHLNGPQIEEWIVILLVNCIWGRYLERLHFRFLIIKHEFKLTVEHMKSYKEKEIYGKKSK